MAYITDYKYYDNEGTVPESANWGTYQYVPLSEIVNNFLLMYVGDDKLVNNVKRYTVLFHAKRAIQELNYDALKNTRVLEDTVDENLKLILPSDYVNYIRISVEKGGVIFPLRENPFINYAREYLKDNNNKLLYDSDGEVLEAGNSHLDRQRLAGKPIYRYGGLKNRYGSWGWDVDGVWHGGYDVGGAYFGLETSQANINDTFRIDKRSGVINFSSGVSGEHIVLEYVSDGMENGVDANISVHKMAEDYVYSYIKWSIIDNKIGIQEYVVRRAKKDQSAKLRNLKIRLSDIHPGRLLQVLRARDKWIK